LRLTPILILFAGKAAFLASAPGERSAEQLDLICNWLSHVKAFKHLEDAQRRPAFDRIQYVQYAPGDAIVSIGEDSTFMCILADGQVKVEVKAEDDTCIEYDMSPGTYFGELGLLDDSPRKATCVATTDASCFVISRELFNEHFRSHYASLNTLPEKMKAIKDNNLFPNARDEDITKIAYSCEVRDLPHRRVMAVQGDEAKIVYLLLTGEVSVTNLAEIEEGFKKHEIELSRFGPGSLFGDVEAMTDEATYACQAKCIGRCRVLELDRGVLKRFVETQERRRGFENHIRREATTKKRFRDQRIRKETKRMQRQRRRSLNYKPVGSLPEVGKEVTRIDTPFKNDGFLRLRAPAKEFSLGLPTIGQSVAREIHDVNALPAFTSPPKRDVRRRSSYSMLQDIVQDPNTITNGLLKRERSSFNGAPRRDSFGGLPALSPDSVRSRRASSDSVRSRRASGRSPATPSGNTSLNGSRRPSLRGNGIGSPVAGVEHIIAVTQKAMQEAGVA